MSSEFLCGFKEIALIDEFERRRCIECVRLVSKFQNRGAPVEIRLLRDALCVEIYIQVSKGLRAVKAIHQSS